MPNSRWRTQNKFNGIFIDFFFFLSHVVLFGYFFDLLAFLFVYYHCLPSGFEGVWGLGRYVSCAFCFCLGFVFFFAGLFVCLFICFLKRKRKKQHEFEWVGVIWEELGQGKL